MRIRRLDNNHDWMFGSGRGDYVTQSLAVAQSVETRLLSLHGDWFLNREHGLKWPDWLQKNPDLTQMESALKNTVLNTRGVAEITTFAVSLDPDSRRMTVQIGYNDVYGKNNEVTAHAPDN